MYKKPENIINFRYWCHKVLPLVYDDSLSYYELLCKVMKKLNEIIDTVNDIDLSELYALIKAIMEMVAGGEYGFDEKGNYNTAINYETGDYVIYNNKILMCTGNTTGDFDNTKWREINIGDRLRDIAYQIAPIFNDNGTGATYFKGDVVRHMSPDGTRESLYIANKNTSGTEFIYDDWDSIKVSDIIFDYSRFKPNMYWGSFKTFYNQHKPYDDQSSFGKNEFAKYDITNSGDYGWDIFMNDCNLFPKNSVMTDINSADAQVQNMPPYEEGVLFTIITYGNTTDDFEPLPTISSNQMFNSDTGVQLAIPRSTINHDDPDEMNAKVMYRTQLYANEWTEWKEISGTIPDFDNLDSVIGATAFAYDSTHTYSEGDYCTVNSSNTVTMYKANQTTTGTFDSSKWTATNIINELKNALIVIHTPNGTFRNGAIAVENVGLSE